MGLHVRLFTNYWTNRKTLKLRSKYGDEAYCIPLRLWTYAADNQPDGDFSAYSDEEMAMLLACPKHASSIRQALLECGFLDASGMIHHWEERNGYHAAFSERAKKAASARWDKREEEDKKRKERKRAEHCSSNACGMLEASYEDEFSEVWKLYPDKSGKDRALKAYKKYRSQGDTQEQVLSGLNRYLAYLRSKATVRFTQSPQNGGTWFGNREWNSEWIAGTNAQGKLPLGKTSAPIMTEDMFASMRAAEDKRDAEKYAAEQAGGQES